MKLWLIHIAKGNEESVYILDAAALADADIDITCHVPGDFTDFHLPGWTVDNIVEVTVVKGRPGSLPLGYELQAVR